MTIEYHKRFERDLAKRSKRIQERFFERQAFWAVNPRDQLLDDHPLGHEYEGCRSFSVGGDLRVIYRRKKNNALFLRFGTHHELYGS